MEPNTLIDQKRVLHIVGKVPTGNEFTPRRRPSAIQEASNPFGFVWIFIRHYDVRKGVIVAARSVRQHALAVIIESVAPGVGEIAMRHDLQLLCARIVAPDRGSIGALRAIGRFDIRFGEDAFVQKDPAVGVPLKGADLMVGVRHPEAAGNNLAAVGAIITVGVREFPKIRRLADVYRIGIDRKAGGDIQPISENGAPIGLAVVISIFEY